VAWRDDAEITEEPMKEEGADIKAGGIDMVRCASSRSRMTGVWYDSIQVEVPDASCIHLFLYLLGSQFSRKQFDTLFLISFI